MGMILQNSIETSNYPPKYFYQSIIFTNTIWEWAFPRSLSRLILSTFKTFVNFMDNICMYFPEFYEFKDLFMSCVFHFLNYWFISAINFSVGNIWMFSFLKKLFTENMWQSSMSYPRAPFLPQHAVTS